MPHGDVPCRLRGDDEPTIDEMLSEETTPITFGLAEGTHFLFDYAGNHLVGADTIEIEHSNSEFRSVDRSVDLRQGKHRLLWIRGLSGSSLYWSKYKSEGVDYDAETGMVSCTNLNLDPLPQYCFKDIEVTPYLMPTQTLDYQPLWARLRIYIYTDIPVDDISKTTITLPYIKSVGLEDNRYTTKENAVLYLALSVNPGEKCCLYLLAKTLCPKDGLDDVELLCNIGSLAYKLPKISLRRGQITEIEGTLQRNATGDFSVTMHQ